MIETVPDTFLLPPSQAFRPRKRKRKRKKDINPPFQMSKKAIYCPFFAVVYIHTNPMKFKSNLGSKIIVVLSLSLEIDKYPFKSSTPYLFSLLTSYSKIYIVLYELQVLSQNDSLSDSGRGNGIEYFFDPLGFFSACDCVACVLSY